MHKVENARDVVNKLIDAWNNKDIDSLSELVSDDVKLVGSLEQLHGKEQYLEGAKQAFPRFSEMKILDQYSGEDGVATVLDFYMNTPKGQVIVNCVEHTKVSNGKIASTVSFYDPRELVKSFEILEGKDLVSGFLKATSMDHVNMRVKNLDDSVRFYKNLFGFEVKHEQSEYNSKIIGNDKIKLCMYEDPQMSPEGGLAHFGFHVENFDQMLDKCKELDVEVLYGGEIKFEKSRSVYIKEPSGYEIEISEVIGGGL